MNAPNRPLRLAVILAAAAACTLAFAGGAPDDNPRPKPNMRAAERAFKTLAGQIEDPAKRAESLESIQQLQLEFLQAKGKRPPRADKLPAAEQAAFVTEYRKAMIDLLEMTFKVERQFLDGQLPEAKASLAKLAELKSSGHDKFRE